MAKVAYDFESIEGQAVLQSSILCSDKVRNLLTKRILEESRNAANTNKGNEYNKFN